jgi:hypothetical protein
MSEQNLKVQSGNQIVVMLDGKAVGLIQSVRGSDDYSPEAASGIGDIHVQEYVPSMARHNITVSTMVLRKANLRSQGIAAKNGDDVLKGRVFDFVSMQKDGTVLRAWRGCSYASGDVEIAKHAIVMSSAQFNALDVDGDGI